MGHHAESSDTDTPYNWFAELNERKNQIELLVIRIENSEKQLKRLTGFLHSRCLHPDYDYLTTARLDTMWDKESIPEGWAINKEKGTDGRERFENTEERYWRRLKSGNISGVPENGLRIIPDDRPDPNSENAQCYQPD